MRITQPMRLRSKRRGFTIVELLVAATVAIILMMILTEAFKRGADMFRHLKAQGDMQERLRTASIILRDDLSSFHFESSNESERYLGGQNLHLAAWNPPAEGFFRIYQGTEPLNAAGDPYFPEGTDPEDILFTRARTHVLHFTVFRRETSATVKNPVDPSYLFRTLETVSRPIGGPIPRIFPQDYVVPVDFAETGVYSSRSSEVAYFLVANGNSAGGTPLYNLHRRSKSLLPNPASGNYPPVITSGGGAIENPEISARQDFTFGGRYYNHTTHVTQPRNRMGMIPSPDANGANLPGAAGLISGSYPTLATDLPGGLLNAAAGDDVVLSDVLSFEVKVLWEQPQAGLPQPSHPPRRMMNVDGFGLMRNSDYPFDYLPLSTHNLVLGTNVAGGPYRVFDTWAGAPSPAAPSFYSQPRPGAPPSPPNPPPPPAWRGDLTNDWTATPTQTGARVPLRIHVKAIKINIRIWNAKAEQTRQITIIQDL